MIRAEDNEVESKLQPRDVRGVSATIFPKQKKPLGGLCLVIFHRKKHVEVRGTALMSACMQKC